MGTIYTINQESAIDAVAAGDVVPMYDTSTGRLKKASMTLIQDFLEAATNTFTGTQTFSGPVNMNGNTAIGNAVTDTIGFYGVTKVAQPSGASQAALTALATTTLSQVATSGKWAFASSTAGNALVNRVGDAVTFINKVRTDLVALGLIKGAA